MWERVFAADTGFPSPYEFALPPMDPAQYEDAQIVGDDTVDGVAARRISAMVRGNYLGSAYDSLYVEMWVGVEDALVRRLTMAGGNIGGGAGFGRAFGRCDAACAGGFGRHCGVQRHDYIYRIWQGFRYTSADTLALSQPFIVGDIEIWLKKLAYS